MGSYKPRSKVDRLPVDYGDEPRKHRRSEKFDGDAGLALALLHDNEDTRWDARCVITLQHQRGNVDDDAVRELVQALGLEPPRRESEVTE